jgi:CheY-like chemotaxis protein
MARILVVDDEMLIREIAAQDLEEAGHQVTTASDGDEAASILEEDRGFDFLFTDIRMPGSIDGWRLAEIAKGLVPDIGIVFASGAHDEPVGQGRGAILSKPYSPKALLASFE